MLAILSETIESAARLSTCLQDYWNSRGVYLGISLFELESEFLSALASRKYHCAILEIISDPLELIPRVRDHCPVCKIAVVTDNRDPAKDAEIAAGCRRLGVEMMLTRADMEQPLAMLSKQLCDV